jgi:hypothetical protein
LEWVSGAIVSGVSSSSGSGEIKLLKVITDPFVQLIIQVYSFFILNTMAKFYVNKISFKLN